MRHAEQDGQPQPLQPIEAQPSIGRRRFLRNLGISALGLTAAGFGVYDERAGIKKNSKLRTQARIEVEQEIPRPVDEAVDAAQEVNEQLGDKSPDEMSNDEKGKYIKASRVLNQRQVFDQTADKRADQKVAQEGHSTERVIFDQVLVVGGAWSGATGLANIFRPRRP